MFSKLLIRKTWLVKKGVQESHLVSGPAVLGLRPAGAVLGDLEGGGASLKGGQI